jgi:hypothetical protein
MGGKDVNNFIVNRLHLSDFQLHFDIQQHFNTKQCLVQSPLCYAIADDILPPPTAIDRPDQSRSRRRRRPGYPAPDVTSMIAFTHFNS